MPQKYKGSQQAIVNNIYKQIGRNKFQDALTLQELKYKVIEITKIETVTKSLISKPFRTF